MSLAIAATTVNRAAIYCRISQDRTGEGLGVGRQEQDCRAWADRHGWTVADVYVDDDISAYKGKPRPSYRRLLADIENHRVDGLVVWHPDRLHRSPAELERFIELVERTGLGVGTVTAGDLDLTTATGRMTARIVGAVARHESEHKSERIRRKALELAQNGKPGGGIRPFGYQADRLTVREDEAALIREAADRILSGEGLRTVCADWNQRGVSTVTGVPWSTTTLRRLLKSGRIVGWREHHGRLVSKGEWEPILDEVTGKRLQRLLDDPSRSTGDTTARVYLLAGMVTCGDPNCGGTLVARPMSVYKNGKRYRYRRYMCAKEKGGCNRVGIGAQPLEDLIVDAALHRLDSKAVAKAVAARSKTKTNPAGDVADIEQRLDDLAEMFANGDITKAEWSKARDRLTERLDQARHTEASTVRQAAADDLLARPDVVRKEWKQMSLERQRLILSALIERIAIKPTTRAQNRFDDNRVDVTWKA